MSTCTSGIPGSQVKYFCTYCQDEISNFSCLSNSACTSITIFVSCSICEEFHLCLMCFSSGAEIGPHKNYHDYKLVTFSNSSIFPLKLLDALEEWTSENTEKYIRTKNLIKSWKDVASAVGYGNPEEVKIEFENLILNRRTWKLFEMYSHIEPIIAYEDAVNMGCFENFNYTNSNVVDTEDVTINQKHVWTKPELELLLECTAIYGYGNWITISKAFNKTVFNEHFGRTNDFVKITPEEIKKEFLLRFYDGPIRRGSWKPPSNSGPIILDYTRLFKQHIALQYPVVDYDLFAFISYNHVVDEFEHPYMDAAESSLDNLYNFEHSKPSMEIFEFTGAFEETDKLQNKLYNLRTLFDIKEEKTLIALERYNNILKSRRIAKKCVLNYRLIEQFAMFKDKKLPKIKRFHEQTFEERLVKISRLMTIDNHKILIENVKNENMLVRRLKELKFYKMIGLTKLSEIELLNTLKKHRHQKTITPLHSTDTRFKPFNEPPIPSGSDRNNLVNYIQSICSKIIKSQIGKKKCQLKCLPRDNCEELLTKTEKMLCLKYNLSSNYYLKTKCDLLNYGFVESSSKIHHVIYKYLISKNKVKVQKPS